MTNKLTVNPKTGFLESVSPNLGTFDSNKKVRFIQLATELAERGEYVNPHTLCKAVGIALRTYMNHMSIDERFKAAMHEAKAIEEALLVERLHGMTKRANGFMPIMARLRDLNGPRWHDQRRVIHEADNASIKTLNERIDTYIDADIVDKDQNDANNQQISQSIESEKE